MSSAKGETVFPSPDIIYRKNTLFELENNNYGLNKEQKMENEKKKKEEQNEYQKKFHLNIKYKNLSILKC